MAADDAGYADQGRQDKPTPHVPAPVPDAARKRGLLRLRGRRAGGAGSVPGSLPEQQHSGRIRASLGFVADRIIQLAPRIPVRDLAALRRQFPGLGPEELADKLISGAAGGSATVGAGVGAAAMLPVPPAMPAELAAEITGVAAVEVKLIAELHEVYGQRPPGNSRQRAMAYLSSWTSEREIDLARPASLNAALGGQLKRELRQQITKRLFRSLPNVTPFMVGATVGAVLNRRETTKVAGKVRAGLRNRQVPWDAPSAPPPVQGPETPVQGPETDPNELPPHGS